MTDYYHNPDLLTTQALNASGLSVLEFCSLTGYSVLNLHRLCNGTVPLTRRESEIFRRLLVEFTRDGVTRDTIRSFIFDKLDGDYLTAFSVYMIDGGHTK